MRGTSLLWGSGGAFSERGNLQRSLVPKAARRFLAVLRRRFSGWLAAVTFVLFKMFPLSEDGNA